MNTIMYDVLLELYCNGNMSQRQLANKLNVSLGLINKSFKILIDKKYMNKAGTLTKKAYDLIDNNKPNNAIILAAGYGVRMVPINTEISKGLLEVNGEILIERIIRQLHEKGIKNIKIVVGFMKEKYEYLIDKYDVELIVNSSYKEKNNLYSVFLVKNYINNSYIIPCDLYCEINPFKNNEVYSWYMISSADESESAIRVNKKFELTKTKVNEPGNRMIGIAYINKYDAQNFIKKIESFSQKSIYDNSFWEETFLHDNEIFFKPNLVNDNDVTEINTYEQLRNIDENSNNLNNETIDIIKNVFEVTNNEIKNINVLKKGMTNRSFIFECKNQKYIMRIPGEGTDKLINRKNEKEVYHVIKKHQLSDDVYYINDKNGYKITKYIDGARTCDPFDQKDLKICMQKLKELHKLNLHVNYEFDLFKHIDFYESLWGNNLSIYPDYYETKEKVFSLKKYIENNSKIKCLTHIDAVPDNFLITKDDVKLIDWEYAAMQDPHVDIAMFAIYSLYKRKEVDNLIDIYFENNCDVKTRLKIYAYISVCGLLWSNWCEFKKNLGVEFGEYFLRQYRYAKEYYKIFNEELERYLNYEQN